MDITDFDHPNRNPKLKLEKRLQAEERRVKQYGPRVKERPKEISIKDWGEATPLARRVMCKNVAQGKKDYKKGLHRLFIPKAANVSIGGGGDQKKGQWVGHVLMVSAEYENVQAIVGYRNHYDKTSVSGLRGYDNPDPDIVG